MKKIKRILIAPVCPNCFIPMNRVIINKKLHHWACECGIKEGKENKLFIKKIYQDTNNHTYNTDLYSNQDYYTL